MCRQCHVSLWNCKSICSLKWENQSGRNCSNILPINFVQIIHIFTAITISVTRRIKDNDEIQQSASRDQDRRYRYQRKDAIKMMILSFEGGIIAFCKTWRYFIEILRLGDAYMLGWVQRIKELSTDDNQIRFSVHF